MFVTCYVIGQFLTICTWQDLNYAILPTFRNISLKFSHFRNWNLRNLFTVSICSWICIFFFISHTFNSVDWFLTDYTIEVYSMCNETATKGFHFHIKSHMCGQSTIIYDYTVHAFLETLPQYTNQLMRLLSIYMLLRYYVKGKRFKMDKPFGFSVGNFSIVLKRYNILFSLRYC